MSDLILFDTETTGLEAGSRLIELAAIRTDPAGNVLDKFQRMVNPGMPLPADALAVNRITADQLAGAPALAETMGAFLEFCSGAAFGVAHFASYDVGILTYALGMVHLPVPSLQIICTCEMAKALKETPNNKLATLVEHHRIPTLGDAHRAAADADACRLYYAIAATRTKPVPKPWAAEYSWCESDELPKHLTILPQAVRDGAAFSFGYVDAKGNRSDRTITPYGWAKTDKGISFHGLCHEKLERRTFLAERVVVA